MCLPLQQLSRGNDTRLSCAYRCSSHHAVIAQGAPIDGRFPHDYRSSNHTITAAAITRLPRQQSHDYRSSNHSIIAAAITRLPRQQSYDYRSSSTAAPVTRLPPRHSSTAAAAAASRFRRPVRQRALRHRGAASGCKVATATRCGSDSLGCRHHTMLCCEGEGERTRETERDCVGRPAMARPRDAAAITWASLPPSCTALRCAALRRVAPIRLRFYVFKL